MGGLVVQIDSVDWDALGEFITIRSMRGMPSENARAIDFVLARLRAAGFEGRVEGRTRTEQPAIIAHRPAVGSDKKIVLYGHYDVAEVRANEKWRSTSPFVTEVIDGRIYARGIADNKGTLFVRMQAIAEMSDEGVPMPEILWLIQGEEEIPHGEERTAKKIFADELSTYDCEVVLEETGFNDLQQDEPIAFVWSPDAHHPKLDYCRKFMQRLQVGRVEFRTLQKLNGTEQCPLLSNLSHRHVYLGFGPNDMHHHIHEKNESLDVNRLVTHKEKFAEFIKCYAH